MVGELEIVVNLTGGVNDGSNEHYSARSRYRIGWRRSALVRIAVASAGAHKNASVSKVR
jgi:hypothetical protein